MVRMTAALVFCLAFTGCKNDDGSDTGPAGTDSGSDSGNTGDSGTSDVTCSDTPATPAPGNGVLAECLTAELACGESVTHATTGGTTVLDAGYATGNWACTGSDPLTGDFSAPERRYWVTAPGDSEPVLTLTSDCDLTMKVVRVTTPCPLESHSVDCSDASGAYTDRVQTSTLFPGFTYEVIIDGVDGGEGAFTLDYDCP